MLVDAVVQYVVDDVTVLVLALPCLCGSTRTAAVSTYALIEHVSHSAPRAIFGYISLCCALLYSALAARLCSAFQFGLTRYCHAATTSSAHYIAQLHISHCKDERAYIVQTYQQSHRTVGF